MRNFIKPGLIAGSARFASMLAAATSIVLITTFPAPAGMTLHRPIGAIMSLADAGQISGKDLTLAGLSKEGSASEATLPVNRAAGRMGHKRGADNDAALALSERWDFKQRSKAGRADRGSAAGALADHKAALRWKQAMKDYRSAVSKPHARRLAMYARLMGLSWR